MVTRSAADTDPASSAALRLGSRSDTPALVARLDDPIAWPEAASALVAELGFRLLGDGSMGVTAGHLVVGLRSRPTMRHFDPESISFYGPDPGGAALVTVGHVPAGVRRTRVAEWGHVHVVDRIPVENRFLTFGGELRLAGLDGGLTVAHLRSPVPIVRWGGHSQGTDSLAGAIGAFFGRLIVPIDFTPGAAARIDAVPPHVLFTAFLREAAARKHAAAQHDTEPSDLDRWLAAAWSKAREDEAARTAADELLGELGL